MFDRSIRSLRDLTKHHLPLLHNIQRSSAHVVAQFGLAPSEVRLFVHYQPSYCTPPPLLNPSRRGADTTRAKAHFHVHIVALENEGYVGLTIGKAHLLSDLISLVSYVTHASP